jgi:putative ABC transport system ATP-binding protein
LPAILELEQVAKKLDSEPDGYLFANVTAAIAEPTIINILGTSGQGKSTLLRILGMLVSADEGTIKLNGIPSDRWVPEKWRMTASYVSQHPVMLPGSVEDNLLAVSRLHQTVFERDYALSLLARVGLEEISWSKQAAHLSGGEKQRLALVRTLLLRPKILLLDEITASLDVHSQHAVEELLQDIHREQEVTLIWVTHQLEQARTVSKRIWFFAERRLLEDSSTEAFFHSPRSDAARAFLQSASLDGKEG